MKKRLFPISLFLFTLLLNGFFSCEEKEDPPARDKFLGIYTVVESCGSGNDSYEITIIESGSAENAVVVFNLYDWDENATASIDGNKINIPSQVLDGMNFIGSGTLSENTLSISLTVSANGQSDNCNLICSQK